MGGGKQERSPVPPLELFWAGALSGAFGKTITAPFDRVKILYQVDPSRRFTIRKAIKTTAVIARTSGIEGLWRGNGAAMMRVIPYAGIMFYIFDEFQSSIYQFLTTFSHNHQQLPLSDSGLAVASRFIAGAAAGATATFLTYPFDLLRARMAAHWHQTPKYPNYIAGLMSIISTEGPFALFRGLRVTLFGIIPYAGVSFMTFETLKALVATHHQKQQQLQQQQQQQQDELLLLKENNHVQSAATATEVVGAASSEPKRVVVVSENKIQIRDFAVPVSLFIGGISGVVAQTVTYPLHVFRRRIQVHTEMVEKSVYRGLANIHSNEGIRGLFKGMSLTLVKGPLTLALTFTTHDFLKAALTQHHTAIKTTTATATATSVSATSPNVSSHHTHPATYIDRRRLSTLEGMIAGGVAGAVSKTVIAPLDRTKIMFQVAPQRFFSLRETFTLLRTIVQSREGVAGLWKGNSATMVRVIPHAAASYVTYAFYEQNMMKGMHFANMWLGLNNNVVDVGARFFSGAAAGATGTLLTYPLDLFRARMATHTMGIQGEKLNYAQLASQMIRREGIKSMYRGLSPTLIGIVPYAGLSFATFETLTAMVRKYRGIEKKKSISVFDRLVCGGIAGLLAQSVTYPLDIVRRRMQVHGEISPGIGYRSLVHALKYIGSHEGTAGLYKGLSLNWIKGPVAVAVSFTVNDYMRHALQDRKDRIVQLEQQHEQKQ